MDLNLEGKRAIITGGSGLIGLAVGRLLGEEGCHVAIVGRDATKISEASTQLAPYCPEVEGHCADTGDDSSVRAMVDAYVGSRGGVDILVNAAARTGWQLPNSRPSLTSDDDVRRELESKVLGYLRFSRAVAPYMLDQGWGRIINIAGLGARRANSLVGSIRNVAVAAMTKNLADELGPRGINVTVVHPGLTTRDRADDQKTIDQGPASSIGRPVTASEVAAVVAFLASPRSVAINGDAVAVGGGHPGPIYY